MSDDGEFSAVPLASGPSLTLLRTSTDHHSYESEITRLKSHLERNLICEMCGTKHDSDKQLATHRASPLGCEDLQAKAVTG